MNWIKHHPSIVSRLKKIGQQWTGPRNDGTVLTTRNAILLPLHSTKLINFWTTHVSNLLISHNHDIYGVHLFIIIITEACWLCSFHLEPLVYLYSQSVEHNLKVLFSLIFGSRIPCFRSPFDVNAVRNYRPLASFLKAIWSRQEQCFFQGKFQQRIGISIHRKVANPDWIVIYLMVGHPPFQQLAWTNYSHFFCFWLQLKAKTKKQQFPYFFLLERELFLLLLWLWIKSGSQFLVCRFWILCFRFAQVLKVTWEALILGLSFYFMHFCCIVRNSSNYISLNIMSNCIFSKINYL